MCEYCEDKVFPPELLASATATRFQVAKAVLFGEKVKANDSGSTITGYWYKGKLYVTKMFIKEENIK